MSLMKSGLFGKISGKLGALVFATWKGEQYVRSFVIPANPNTAGQQAQRTLFANIVYFAKAILGGVIQPFWDPFYKDNSGWAKFMSLNLKSMHPTFDPTKAVMSAGTLEGTPITGATYAGVNVTITWDPTTLGNGAATDKAVCVVYDFTNHVAFVNSTVARSAGTANVNVGTGRNTLFMWAYMFFVDSATAPTSRSASDDSTVV